MVPIKRPMPRENTFPRKNDAFFKVSMQVGKKPFLSSVPLLLSISVQGNTQVNKEKNYEDKQEIIFKVFIPIVS